MGALKGLGYAISNSQFSTWDLPKMNPLFCFGILKRYVIIIYQSTSFAKLKSKESVAAWLYHLHSISYTVTNLANSCVTPLFRRPQDSQGCLEKWNHPLSSNLVVWCAKIGPKTKKLQKTVKKSPFLTFFCQFWGFSNFLGFGPNFSAPNHQIRTQWMILLL